MSTDDLTYDGPFRDLSSSGIVISWGSGGSPNPRPAVPDPNRTVGGYPAKVTTAEPGTCTTPGTAETIQAHVGLPRGQDVVMTACLGPEHRMENERIVEHVLDSAVFAEP